MGSKVYEASTLKAATKERAQHYEELREQFVRLKKEFGKIVDDGQFQGHGAEAIKGFYQAQSDIVDAWLRFIDVNIEFFKSIPGYAEDANLAENSIVQVPFLEENVSQGLQSAIVSVADQQDSLQNIFNGINDLVSLTVFSKEPFDEQMDQADKKRTRTVEAVNAIDQQLTQEYLGLQNLVEQVNELYSAMINATRQGENISPLYFNAEAYKTSTVFKMQSELKTQAAGYVKQKRSERMPSAMKQLSQEAKVYTLKKEKGFFTEIWDNVQSGSGSALDDTVDGLVNMVKNPGETFDGLKYAAAHPIKTGSAAWDQLSTSFNEEVIHGDAGSRAHYFSYMGTQLGVSVLGGKGIDKLSKVSKADLAKGMGKVKKHTYVVNKKSTAYLERFNLLFAKERLAADGFNIDVKDLEDAEKDNTILQASNVDKDRVRNHSLVGIRIINYKYAVEVYKLKGKLGEKYPKGVKFSNEGFPDFSPYSKVNLEIEGLLGDHYYDFKMANEALGLKNTPAGYTWHHVEDGKTMMLVPSDIHGEVRHTGGASLIKKGLRP